MAVAVDTPVASTPVGTTPAAPPAASNGLPPGLPPPWSQIQQVYDQNGTPPETQRAAFQKWSSVVLGAARTGPNAAKNTQTLSDFIDQQYQKFDTPPETSTGEKIASVAKAIPGAVAQGVGSLALMGAAPADLLLKGQEDAARNELGVTQAQSPSFFGGIASTAGADLKNDYQNLKDLAAERSAEGGVGIPGIAQAAFNEATGNTKGQAAIDQQFDILKNRVRNNQPIDGKFLSQWGNTVQAVAAAAHGAAPGDYDSDVQDIHFPANLGLLAAFKATRDPQTLNALKQNLTQPAVRAEAQKQIAQSSVGMLPDWLKSTVIGASDPQQLALMAAAPEIELPDAAVAGLSPLRAALNKGAVKAVGLGALNTALGGVQGGIENPDQTTQQRSRQAILNFLSGAGMGAAFSAVGHAFGGRPETSAETPAAAAQPPPAATPESPTPPVAAPPGATAPTAAPTGDIPVKTPTGLSFTLKNQGDSFLVSDVTPPPNFPKNGVAVLSGQVTQRLFSTADTLGKSIEINPGADPRVTDYYQKLGFKPQEGTPNLIYEPTGLPTGPEAEAIQAKNQQANVQSRAEGLDAALKDQDLIRQSGAGGAALRDQLAQEAAQARAAQVAARPPIVPFPVADLTKRGGSGDTGGLGNIAAPTPPPPSPIQAIDAGKAATGGGKSGESAGLNLGVPPAPSIGDIVAQATKPGVEIGDIATQPGMEKIPVNTKANLQVAAALRPETVEQSAAGQQAGKDLAAEVVKKFVPPPAPDPNAANEVNGAAEPQKVNPMTARERRNAEQMAQERIDAGDVGELGTLSKQQSALDRVKANHQQIRGEIQDEADPLKKIGLQQELLEEEMKLRELAVGRKRAANAGPNVVLSEPTPQAINPTTGFSGYDSLPSPSGKSATTNGEDVLYHGTPITFGDINPDKAVPRRGVKSPHIYFSESPIDASHAAFSGAKGAREIDLERFSQGDIDGETTQDYKNELIKASNMGRDILLTRDDGTPYKATKEEIQNASEEELNGGWVIDPKSKGRPRLIQITAKGPTLDLSGLAQRGDPIGVYENRLNRILPPDLKSAMEKEGKYVPWKQGGSIYGHENSSVLTQWARAHGYAKIKVPDSYETAADSGGNSVIVLPDAITSQKEVLPTQLKGAYENQPTPDGGKSNATQARKVQNDDILQRQGTAPGAAIPADEDQVRPGNGEPAGGRGGPQSGAQKPVRPSPTRGRNVPGRGRPGFVTTPEVPDWLAKGIKKITNAYERGENNDQISAEKDAANQMADIEARRSANDIRGALSRAFPSFYSKGAVFQRDFLTKGKSAILPEDATAMLQETEAGNDGPPLNKAQKLVMLDKQANTIKASKVADPKQAARALAAIQFAKDNYDKLAPIAADAADLYDIQHGVENHAGLQSPGRAGYVYHAQDIESPEGYEATLAGAGPNARFTMGRSHPTYADSIAAGVPYHTLSAPDLLEARIRNGSRMINNTAWVDGLGKINDPINGAPLTVPVEKVKRPNGPDYETVPNGYTKVDLSGRRVGIQNPYVKLVQALTNPSAFESEQLGRMLREGSQLKKSIMTTLDTFHLGWGAWRAAAAKLGSLDNPIPTFRSLKGRLALDFTPEEAQRMADAGQVPQAFVKGIAERQRVSDLLVKNGLLPGRGTDSIHQEFTKSLPIIGGTNKYIFDGFIRSAINEIATREFQVQGKMFPDLSQDQLARKVSGEVNTWMGNVGSRGIFKSKTFQDITRMAMLAPGLTEGRLRSEVGAPIQALQAIPQSIKAGRPAAGLYARGTAAALLGAATAAQLANLYFRGKPTWQNPEEGHDAKISGYLPDIIGGGPGLFYNPLQAAMPTVSQIHDIYARTGDIGKTIAQFARDKSGPLTAPLWDLSGTGPTGQPLKSGVTSAALGFIPSPIAGKVAFDAAKQVATGKHSETYPGEFERQSFSSFGVRTTSVPAAEQRIGQLADTFKKSNNIPVHIPGSEDDDPYLNLNSALRAKNTTNAQTALTALLDKKTPDQVQKYFLEYPLRSFTGSEKNDVKFKATLTPEQLQAYNGAVANRAQLAQTALNLLAAQPGADKSTIAAAKNFPQLINVAKIGQEQTQQRAAVKTQAQTAYDALSAAKTPQDQQAALAAAHASPEVTKEFKALVAQGNKARLEGDNADIIKRMGSLGVDDGERAKAVISVLSGLQPDARAQLNQQLLRAGVLPQKVVAQINRLRAQQAQGQPQAAGQ